MARGGARPGAGRPRKSAVTPKPRKSVGATPAATPETVVDQKLPADITAPAAAAGLSPLDYMLQVMRDDEEDPARRDRMAMAAAPFVHCRAADMRPNLHAVRADAAKQAAGGRFAASTAPRLVANNTIRKG